MPKEIVPYYRRDIDGLRGIAILAVVLGHAFPAWVSGGYVGVDIFFVISGYLITKNIFQENTAGIFSFSAFYKRRILRLFPALAAMLGAAMLFGVSFLFPDEIIRLGQQVFASAFFVANLLFWRETGYFDVAAETKPLLHLWSLGIEEQFYLVWPFLLVFSMKPRRFSKTCFFTPLIASFLINIWFYFSHPQADFYLPFSRMWEFGIGGVIALWEKDLRFIIANPKLRNMLSLYGVFFLVLSIEKFGRFSAYPGLWALLPTIGASLLIFSGSEPWFNRKILGSRALVGMGLVSYPLYLWHWPILVFYRIFTGSRPSLNCAIMLLILSVALAWMSFLFVEQPAKRLARRHGNSVIALLAVCMLFIGVAGILLVQDSMQFVQNNNLPSKLNDLIADTSRLQHRRCPEKVFAPRYHVRNCEINSTAPPQFALIGDSHAEFLFYGFAKDTPGKSWMLLSHNSCPPFLGNNMELGDPQCTERMKNAYEAIAQVDSIKTVALFFYGQYYLKVPSPDRKAEFTRGLEEAIRHLLSLKKHVVILLDSPTLPFSPHDCLRRRKAGQGDCSIKRNAALEAQAPYREIVQQLAKQYTGVQWIDLFDFFCDGENCRFEDNDMLFYFDSQHLSFRGSAKVAAYLLKAMH